MKRVLAWILVVVLCLGLFAGCKKNKDTDPTTGGDATVATADLQAALEYIKTVYKKPAEKTPKDYQRIGVVPVNGKQYEVVWSADVGEEFIKVVKGTDGMVTIDVNEQVEAEVKYVLTATISDDQGNSVSHSWNHLIPTASNMVAIVEEAYALKPGESMGYEVTLTGKITQINTPYDAGYKNITVTIVVEGAEDKPIMCYRLKGEGADKLKPNDIITVTGTIKNYNGTIEFDAGCTLDAVIEGEAIKAPTDPKQIIKEAYALAQGGALPYEATLTGVITKVNTEYNPQYKNVTVTMVVDGDTAHPIQCYRLAGDGADKIGKGDTITVTGWLVNYKGTVQFGQGCTLDSWKDTGANEAKPEDTFTTTLVPEIVTDPQEGVAYKFFMYQKSYDKNFYLNGEMDGYYYATTYDPAKAADVYVEEVSGGYRLYIEKSGVKNYMEVLRQYSSSTSKYHNNVVFSTNPTAVWKWNSEIKSFTIAVDVDGTMTNFYLGTYSFYKTFSASDVSRITGDDADKMDTENFVGRLAIMKETKVTAAQKAFEELKSDYPVEETVASTAKDYTRKNVYEVDGEKVNVVWTANSDAVTIVDNGDGTVTVKVTAGDDAIDYTLTATITDGDEKLVASWNYKIPAAGLPTEDGADLSIKDALKFGAQMAHNTYTEIKFKVTGEISSVYNTTFGNMKIVDADGNELTLYGTYNEDGTVRYDAMDVKPVEGDTITIYGILGQYNGTPQIKNGWIVAHTPGENEDPDTPVDPEEPGDDVITTLVPEIVTAPQAGVAYKFFMYQKNIDKNLYLTGEMNSYYYATTEDPAAAVDVYLEQVSGGWRAYFMKDEVKYYLEMAVNGTYKNVVFVTEPTKTLKWNAEAQTITCDLTVSGETKDYYWGTYQTYNTFSASDVSRVTGAGADLNSNFVGHLATMVDTEVNVAEEAFEELKKDYPANSTAQSTSDNFDRKNVYELYGETVNVVWSDNSNAVAIRENGNGTITVVVTRGEEDVPYTLTATITDGDTVYTTSWDYIVPAVAPVVPDVPATPTYTKITSMDELVSGQYVMVVSNGYAPATYSDGWVLATQPVIDGNQVTDASNAVWTITVDGTSVKLTDANGVTIAPKSGNNNGVQAGDYSWAVTCEDGTFKFAGVGSDTTKFACNTGSDNKFRSYKVSTLTGSYAANYPHAFTLYKLDEVEQAPAVSTYNKITSADALVSGQYVMVVSNGYAPSIYSDGWVLATQPEVAGDTIVDPQGCVWTLTVDGTSVKLQDANGVTIAPKSGNNNGVQEGDYSWAVTFENGTFKFAGVGSDTTRFACNTGSDNKFRSYKVSTLTGSYAANYPHAFTLYKLSGTTTGGNAGSGSNSGTQAPADPITNVVYSYGSTSQYSNFSNVIKNWGRRGFNATFLSPNAIAFYADNNVTYEELAALEGSSNLSNVPSSALYIELQDLMESNHTRQTTYGETRDLYVFTDCQDQDTTKLTCFYSGNAIGPNWDGSSWNREHCWPKSKANATWNSSNTNSNTGEVADLMTLRPTKANINSSRSNKAYGISASYYDPNSAANNNYNLRGDVARIVLYTYVRWENTEHMWGSDGVIESVDVLLDWIEADPVDTWELGRNDSVESVTGTRNVFVDYPELAFVLFDEEIPTMVTPSGKAA